MVYLMKLINNHLIIFLLFHQIRTIKAKFRDFLEGHEIFMGIIEG